MELGESEVREAAQHLGTLGYARLATGPGSRTAKYRQLFGEALDLMPAEVSLLAVLMLRGPQTVAQLLTRTERLHRFESNEDLTAWLGRLDGKELVQLLPKQPGQREERWAHLLADGPTGAGPVEEPERPAGEPSSQEQRLARLEDRVAELERALAERGLLP
jgi:uncharacterized protein YceH (UPF0502 family)